MLRWTEMAQAGSNAEQIHQDSQKPATFTFTVVVIFIHAFVRNSNLTNYVLYTSIKCTFNSQFLCFVFKPKCQIRGEPTHWLSPIARLRAVRDEYGAIQE